MQEFINIYSKEKVTRDEVKESEVTYDGKMMIAEIDNDGVITYTNRKLREMLGYEKAEIVGLPFTVSLHPDMPEGLCRQAFELADEGKIWAGYAKSITRSGEFFWTAVCVQAKYETDESVSGYIIRKKSAREDIIEEVQEEFSNLRNLKLGEYKSEFCGEMHM